jgi:hypothetical protein
MVVYIDDTVIYRATVDSFLTLLNQVLGKMLEFNVRLKQSKRFFSMEEIEFLGHIIDANGIRLGNARVQGIRGVPESTSAKAVRSFIGKVN